MYAVAKQRGLISICLDKDDYKQLIDGAVLDCVTELDVYVSLRFSKAPSKIDVQDETLVSGTERVVTGYHVSINPLHQQLLKSRSIISTEVLIMREHTSDLRTIYLHNKLRRPVVPNQQMHLFYDKNKEFLSESDVADLTRNLYRSNTMDTHEQS